MLDVLPKSKIPKPCMPFNPLLPISSNPLRLTASKHSVTNATSMIKLCYIYHVLRWLCTVIWHIISRAQDMLPILFAAFGSNCPSWNNESLTCSRTGTNHHGSAHGHNTSRNSQQATNANDREQLHHTRWTLRGCYGSMWFLEMFLSFSLIDSQNGGLTKSKHATRKTVCKDMWRRDVQGLQAVLDQGQYTGV